MTLKNKWLHSIRSVLKMIKAKPSGFLLMVVLPLLMVIFFGAFYSNIFHMEGNVEKVGVNLKDNGNKMGKAAFESALRSPQIQEVITMKEDAQFTIELPKGFDDRLAKDQNTKVILHENKRAEMTNGPMVELVVKEVTKALTSQAFGQRLVKNGFEPTQAANLMNELNALETTPALKLSKVQPLRVLNLYETYTASFFGIFLFYTLALNAFSSVDEDRKSGVFIRMRSLPISAVDLYHHYIRNLGILAFLANLAFFLVVKAFDLALKNVQIWQIFVVSFLLAVLIAGFASVFLLLKNKGQASLIIMLPMYLQMFLGGGFLPKFLESPLIDKMIGFLPGMWMEKFLRQLQLTGSIAKSLPEIYLMFPVAILIYFLTRCFIPKTWEAN